MSPASHRVSNRLDSLEPHGSAIQLDDLLRWRLAASQLPLTHRRSSVLAGGRRSPLRGRGIDFDEVRLYQPGDDVRAIDWRVTARASKPHTKLFREEKERPVLLVIDMRSTMFFGSRNAFKSVIVAHCAALLAWATLESGDRIGALIVSDDGITDIKPRRNRHALLQIFRKLVAVQQDHLQRQQAPQAHDPARIPSPRIPSLTDVIHQLRAVSKPGSCLVLLSDFHDWQEECVQALFPAVRHSQAFAVRISDPLEQQLPDIGTVRFRFAQWMLPVDTAERQLRQRYAEQQQQQRLQWLHDWQRLGCIRTDITTVDAILPALRALFGGSRSSSVHTSQPVMPHSGEAAHAF